MEKPRPSYNDNRVVEGAAKKLLPSVIKWLKNNGDQNPEDEESGILADLESAIRYETDAYRMAYNLHKGYWEPDYELVEILSGASFLMDDSYRDLVEEWVTANDIKPQYSIEAQVTLDVNGKSVTGEIVQILAATAQYVIHCPELGHVKKGVGTHGLVINYEDVD